MNINLTALIVFAQSPSALKEEYICISLLFSPGSSQNFCSKSVPVWPPQSALRLHLGPLGQSCVDVCHHSSHVCEPALFHHLNSPAAFSR